jgi:hypothetical protein
MGTNGDRSGSRDVPESGEGASPRPSPGDADSLIASKVVDAGGSGKTVKADTVEKTDAAARPAAKRRPGTVGSDPGECGRRHHDARAVTRSQEVRSANVSMADAISAWI